MGVGYVAPGWSRSREALTRWRRRAFDRLRGHPNLERLVAQGLELGEGAFVARGVHLDTTRPWLISIGEGAVISPGVFVLTHDASMVYQMGFARIARVVIGKGAIVGAGAILLPGTRIGDAAIVGAGSVVHGKVAPGAVVVGNPAKVVSNVRLLEAWYRAGAAQAPSWPHEGWSSGSGITEERKRAQRAALADGISGYVSARAAAEHHRFRQHPPE